MSEFKKIKWLIEKEFNRRLLFNKITSCDVIGYIFTFIDIFTVDFVLQLVSKKFRQLVNDPKICNMRTNIDSNCWKSITSKICYKYDYNLYTNKDPKEIYYSESSILVSNRSYIHHRSKYSKLSNYG